jgi:uncharacterized membrane protein
MAPKSPVSNADRSAKVANAATADAAVPEIDAELVDGYGDEEMAPPGVSRRVRIAALVLSLLGLADSAYLTIAHFEQSILNTTCSTSGAINCTKVTTSAQSHIFGIPVAILGLAFYVAMTAINLPPLWKTSDVRVAWLRLAMAVSGIGFVLYLVYAELFEIKAICEYCTGVLVVTFALFVLIVVTLPSMTQRQPAGWDDGDWEEEPELSPS